MRRLPSRPLATFAGAALFAAAAALPAAGEESPLAAAERKRQEALARLVERATELIQDRNYDSKTTPHYKVRTDDPRLDVAGAAELLEAFRAAFEETWAGKVGLKPHAETTQVFLFYSYYKYKQLLGTTGRESDDRPIGHYASESNVIALHSDSGEPGDLAGVIVHEAAHQLIQMRIYGPDTIPATWVTEGLAAYYGYTARDAGGRFRPGRIGGTGARLLKEGGASAKRPAAEHAALESALRKGAIPPLRAFVLEAGSEFYGADARLRYAAAWMLVHYLLHGEEGARAAGFARFLVAEAEGKGSVEILLKEIGLDEPQLEAAFRKHVARAL